MPFDFTPTPRAPHPSLGTGLILEPDSALCPVLPSLAASRKPQASDLFPVKHAPLSGTVYLQKSPWRINTVWLASWGNLCSSLGNLGSSPAAASGIPLLIVRARD